MKKLILITLLTFFIPFCSYSQTTLPNSLVLELLDLESKSDIDNYLASHQDLIKKSLEIYLWEIDLNNEEIQKSNEAVKLILKTIKKHKLTKNDLVEDYFKWYSEEKHGDNFSYNNNVEGKVSFFKNGKLIQILFENVIQFDKHWVSTVPLKLEISDTELEPDNIVINTSHPLDPRIFGRQMESIIEGGSLDAAEVRIATPEEVQLNKGLSKRDFQKFSEMHPFFKSFIVSWVSAVGDNDYEVSFLGMKWTHRLLLGESENILKLVYRITKGNESEKVKLLFTPTADEYLFLAVDN
jgi:hypothetical protein